MKTASINETNSDSILYNLSSFPTNTKLVIAVLFGMACFFLSPYGISASMGETIINIPWSVMFPIMISMAFGWRYGLVSSLIGGALYPFLLWPEEGWANVLTSIQYLAFFTAIGFINGMPVKTNKLKLFYWFVIIVLIYILVSAIGYLILFKPLLSLNPPFWYTDSINNLDDKILFGIFIKDAANFVFLTILSDTLLRLPIIRRLFLMEVKTYMRLNLNILLSVFLASLVLWLLFYGLEFVLLQTHRTLNDGHLTLAFFVIVIGGFSASRLIIYFTERQLLTNDILIDNQIKFKTVADFTYDWEYWDGADGQLKYMSPSCERISGYKAQEFLSDRMFFKKIVFHDDTDLFDRHFADSHNSNLIHDIGNFDFRIIKKDGTIAHINHLCTPVFDETGNFIGRRISNRDVTERKLAEHALKESEEKYRDLVENSPDAIAIYVEGKIVYVNYECLSLMAAKNKSDLLGKSVMQFIHPDYRELVMERMKKSTIENIMLPIAEEKFLRLDGSEVDVEVKALPIKFENKQAVQLIVRDISERKQVELELKENEKKFRNLIELAADGILIGSHEGIILDANSHFCFMIGMEREQLIGIPIQNLPFTRESIEKAPFRFDLLMEGKTVMNERVIIKPDGNSLIVEMRSKMMPDKTYQAIFTDITERKKNEIALLEIKANMAAIIENTTDSIWAINTRYEILYINDVFYQAYKESFGIELKVGMNLLEYVPEDIRPIWKSRYDKAFGKEPFIIEDKIDLGFTIIYIELLGNPILVDGKVIGASFFSRNITERVRMEQAIKESEEKYRLTFFTSPDSVNINKMDGTYMDVNDSFTRITGYTREDVIGKLSSEIEIWARPQDRDKLVKELKERGTVENMESIFRCKDGTIKTALMSARILKINNTPHILSITRDITERKILENTLKKSEEQFRKLFERSSNAIFLIDRKNGNYLDANKAAEELTGYSVLELKKMNTLGIAPKGAKERLARIADLKATLSLGEIEYIQPNLSKRYALLSVVPLNETMVFGIAHDITERKEFEARLRILSTAIEQSPVSVVITNTDGIIEYVNPKFIRVTQYNSEEAIGKNPRFLKSGTTSKKEYETLWNTIKTGKEWSGEFCNLKKNGEIFWEWALISPIINEKGNITHFVAVKEDITDRKETERKILSTIIETEERERNRFSRDLHDGLGPLLSTVKLYFQWLSETDDLDKKRLITEKGDKNLNEAIESLREISNNLSPRTLTSFGVEAAIKNFIENLNQSQKLNIEFESNATSRYDKNIEITIYRIATELLNNTIKYAQASKSLVKLVADPNKEWITLEYTDNGKGFDLNEVQSRSKGYGLTNIMQRVNTLKGTITITTSLDKGIQVIINLPLGKN